LTREPPDAPLGNINSFEPAGPRYQVGEAIRPLEDGDWLIGVTLVETGEKAEYRLSRLLDDPEAY
jgi:hypothetical protein